MSGLSMAEMVDLTDKLNKLHQLSDDRDKASTAVREARDRWNSARKKYAEIHAQIVSEYGEQNAPRWLDSIHGTRTTIAALSPPANESKP